MLVVLDILAILGGIAYANMERDTRQSLEAESRRLAGALEHAVVVAQFRDATLGISADGHGYRFWQRSADDRWVPIADDQRLSARALPDDIDAHAVAYA